MQKSSHSKLKKMEVAAGLEPAKTGFADQRLDRFGIATKPSSLLALESVIQNPPGAASVWLSRSKQSVAQKIAP